MISTFVRTITIRCPVTNERYDISISSLTWERGAGLSGRVTTECACGLSHIIFDSQSNTEPTEQEYEEIEKARREYLENIAAVQEQGIVPRPIPRMPRRRHHWPDEVVQVNPNDIVELIPAPDWVVPVQNPHEPHNAVNFTRTRVIREYSAAGDIVATRTEYLDDDGEIVHVNIEPDHARFAEDIRQQAAMQARMDNMLVDVPENLPENNE